jgi:hypothetical protein
VQGRWLHVTGMAFWAVQMVGAAVLMPFDWRLYLLEISLAANFLTNLAGWSAERPTELAEPSGG